VYKLALTSAQSLMKWSLKWNKVYEAILYPCRGYYDFSQKFATQWRIRFRPHKVYIFLISITRRVDVAMSVCPSVSTQTCLLVLKLLDWNFLKSLLSLAGSVEVGTSRIGQLYLTAPIRIIGKKIFKKIMSLVFFNI